MKLKSKLIFLILLFIGVFFTKNTLGQCNNTFSYGSATAPSSGTTTIATCQWQSEYNTISGAISGTTYESNITAGGCITITQGTPTGPVVAFGNAPVQWTAPTPGALAYYVHYTLDCGPACNTAIGCETSTITYISGGGGGCGGGAAGSNCANATVVNTVPYAFSGTTCGAGNCYSSSDACGSLYMNGEDYVFEFTPAITGPFEFVTNGTTTWAGIFVLDGCPDAAGTNVLAPILK